ncbi:MAG TPA: LacI family DNA-binding transcriptional regulator [Chthonomonadaceae bacterium]|nr:LacI family DNA-binding transcriptional regulator [Chthonomonadaceae bacterium]
MAVTIRQVAARAGVTKGVVSTVLSGRQTTTRVSEETRQRVLKAAAELHYRPNAMAKGLARKRADTLGIIPQWSGYLSAWSGFVSEMMQGITAAALREHYGVLLNFLAAEYNPEEESLEQQVADVMDGRLDGALLWRPPGDPLAQHLHESAFPIVMMFGSHDNPDIASVDCDNLLGGRLATEYLLSLGHTRILHLTANARENYVRERCLGYQQALSNAGIPVRPEWIVDVGWEKSGDETYERLKPLFEGDGRATAVFAWYDGVAFRMLEKAREWGLNVPQQLSMVGFDGTAQYAYTAPPLTSVYQPIKEIADCAATLLIQQIRGESVEEIHRIFPPILEERRSCAPPERNGTPR